MQVFDSNGQLLADITQDQNCRCEFALTIRDGQHQQVRYKIANNVFAAVCNCCCNDRYLYVFDSNGQKVSTITKQWRGCATECCTPADALLIEFTPQMTVGDKAALICGVLLADYSRV